MSKIVLLNGRPTGRTLVYDIFIALGDHLGRPIRTQESALFEIKTICYKRGFYAHYEKLRLASGVNI